MKKLLLLAAAFIGFATTASAQTFDLGTQHLTATVGFGSGNSVPVAISYEYGIVDFGGDHKLGLGGNALFFGSVFGLAAECNYHFVGVEKLDLYGGVRLGRYFYNNGGTFLNSVDLGANYFFNSDWAINGEIGLSGYNQALKLGITHRF